MNRQDTRFARHKKSEPAVTVLMAVYNGLPYVRQAVESILAQEGVEFALLILDDASTDGTWDYLQTLDDPRLRLERNAVNLGLTATLNRGLALGETPYVARMDADDLSLPGRLAAQRAFLDAHANVILVGCGTAWIDEQGRILQTADLPADDAAIRARLRHENTFTHGAVMFRREAALAVGGYRAGFHDAQDYDLWLRLSEQGRLANLPDVFYHLRRHSAAKSTVKWARVMAFRDLARELTEVRAAGQDDNTLYEQRSVEIMAQYASTQANPRHERRFLAGRLRSTGVHHLRQGRYLTGAGFILRALLHDPFEPGFWRGISSGLRRVFRRKPPSAV